MQIGVRINNMTFNADALNRRVGQKLHSAIVSSVKYLHKSVRHAIRIAKKPSRPGYPPHSRMGTLKNAVASKVVGLAGYVGITTDLGSPEGLAEIAAIHEYGVKIPYRGKVFVVGGAGPLARRRTRSKKIGKNFSYGKLRTAAQVARAQANYRAFYGAPQSTADYPERSFLRSTLNKVFPIVMQKFFKQS